MVARQPERGQELGVDLGLAHLEDVHHDPDLAQVDNGEHGISGGDVHPFAHIVLDNDPALRGADRHEVGLAGAARAARASLVILLVIPLAILLSSIPSR